MLQIPEETLERMRAARERTGSARHEVQDMLKAGGLRPTRQRIALAALLFSTGRHRHVTADDLHRDARAGGTALSLATVYNTLNQFADAGLIRKIGMNGERMHFDTDPGDHHHFYVEAEDRVLDVEPGAVCFSALPAAPAGYEIAGVDVVIRLRRSKPEKARDACSGRCARRAGSGGDMPR